MCFPPRPQADRDQTKDLGYFWVKPDIVKHYYRSNAKSNLAASHCGRIVNKNKLVEINNLPTCSYCQYIEGQRDTRLVKE